ncbi:Phosphatidylinositol-4-phosphate 5-kinase [Entomortierella chlamydospora]|nr:Phosphatidylinositol-4-phosphate 5-kinase [Entomortierella chlamydospora]
MQAQVHPDLPFGSASSPSSKHSTLHSRQSSTITPLPLLPTKEHSDIVDLTYGIPHTPSLALKPPHTPPPSSPKTLAAQQTTLPSTPQHPSKEDISSLQQPQPNRSNYSQLQWQQQDQQQQQQQQQPQQQQQQDYTHLTSQDQHAVLEALEPSPTLSATGTSSASARTSVSSPASSVSYLNQNNTLHTSPTPAPAPPASRSDVSAEQNPLHTTTLRPKRSNNVPSNTVDLDSVTLPIPRLSSTTLTNITSSVHPTTTIKTTTTTTATTTLGELAPDSIDTVVNPICFPPQHSPSLLTLDQDLQLQEQELENSPQPTSVDFVVTVSTIRTGVIELDTDGAGSSSPTSVSEPSAPLSASPRRASTLDPRRVRRGSQFEDPATGVSRQPQFPQGEFSSRARRRQIYRRNTYSADIASASFNRSDDEMEMDELEEARRRMEVLKKSSSRRTSKWKKDDDTDRVLIGTPISEDHVNYVLMYNMLTGIRVSVSRCNAKPQRALVDEDFTAAHKLAFDITGNELTPSSKYDFKFKDYAPWVFRHLRQDFHIDASDYLVSLTSKYILSELGSPGKSGSFFYFSQDYRFIIKTIHHAEHKFMRKILKDYFNHVKHNPHTLLCRFFGLHRVKLPHGRKIHFVVMGNVFPPNRDIHETYDLKGSTLGRAISDEELQNNPRATQKDLNWVNRNRKLELGPEKRHLFVEQIKRDVELLARLNIMDYSLLVGIHDIERGNKDNIRDNTLKVFNPDASKPLTKETSRRDKRTSKLNALRMAVKVSDPVALGPLTLPSNSFSERRNCIFYADDGGLLSTNERNEQGQDLYYLGIIDILTPYNYVKKIEHLWKSLSQDKHAISAVNPHEYAQRFLSFMIHALKVNHDVLSVLDKNSHPHTE